jgi:hypothetical protein
MAAHQGWFLIDPWTTSAELWRPTSISGAVVTCALATSETLTASNISFTAATKKIAGTAEAISKFFPGEKISVTGSASNNGTYTVAGYPTDGSYNATYITVVEALVDESAGASVTIQRKRRAHSDGAVVLFTQGPIPVTWYGAKASADSADASANRAAIQRALDDTYYTFAYDIYVPGFMAGRYFINAPLYLEKLTHLHGVNQKTSVIAASSTFAGWNDDVAMIQTRRNGLPCTRTQGGNDRYFITSIGLDGVAVAYAKSTGFDSSSDTTGTAYVTTGTNTVAIHATLLVGIPSIHQRIVYRALAAGAGGNSIRIAHVNDGASQPLTVTAAGNDITVHLATNGSSVITSTINDVVTAVNADADSNGLVQASLGNEGDQKFNIAGSALVAYNDGTALATAFALTALGAGTAPFASGDVGRSIYLGMRYGARQITAFTNSSTVTVSGSAFSNSRAGLRFAVSPVNGIIGAYNQTSILTDMRIESCPGYAASFSGCQEFTVKNLMTLFSGVHRYLLSVQFGHFYDCNMEHTLDAYVVTVGDTSNINRSNHFIGGHIEDVGPCDYWRHEGTGKMYGNYVVNYQATMNTSCRILRAESTLQALPSYSFTHFFISGPNDGITLVSDAYRGINIPAQPDFPEGGLDYFFMNEGMLNLSRKVVSKTSAYTLRAVDALCRADATGGAFTVTLPSAVAYQGIPFTVKRTNSAANNVTVGTTASQTIDGVTTVTLAAQYDRVTVISDGANWARID